LSNIGSNTKLPKRCVWGRLYITSMYIRYYK
jgi:hypothetical protein